MYDEVHYLEGVGRAKSLQLAHQARPADLAELIAAAYPELAEQERAGNGPPPGISPVWPWHAGQLAARVAEAQATLIRRKQEVVGPAS
jgi:hypothetical protein